MHRSNKAAIYMPQMLHMLCLLAMIGTIFIQSCEHQLALTLTPLSAAGHAHGAGALISRATGQAIDPS